MKTIKHEITAESFDTRIDVDLFTAGLDAHPEHEIQECLDLQLSVDYANHGGVGWPVLKVHDIMKLMDFVDALKTLDSPGDVLGPEGELKIRLSNKDIPTLIDLLQSAYIADKTHNKTTGE